MKLEHSSMDTIQMTQKAAAVGNFSFVTTTHLLLHHVSCRVFGETAHRPGDSAPLQPRLGALRLLAFPKTKITFESEEISDHE